jgi:hypothetical protein
MIVNIGDLCEKVVAQQQDSIKCIKSVSKVYEVYQNEMTG